MEENLSRLKNSKCWSSGEGIAIAAVVPPLIVVLLSRFSVTHTHETGLKVLHGKFQK